jgi:ABC-type multidrug transport system ATPase subunit
MIQFTNVTKRFHRFTAVDQVSFQVPAQQAVALWGANGAGKTTLLKSLLGLLRYQGEIHVAGYDAQRQGRKVRALLGYVPQELAFYDDLNTLATAHYFARLKQAPARRVPLVLEQVGLWEHRAKAVGALSGGMKQRLGLGLALLADPPILVLDEPTSNLDAAARTHFLALLSEVRAAGKTILFTSHRIEEIEQLADQVVVMAGGQVKLCCAAHDLSRQLGIQTQVKLHVASHLLDHAVQLLTAEGLAARRNGVGVLVNVPHGAKAQPIHLLTAAGIVVTDFEIEG